MATITVKLTNYPPAAGPLWYWTAKLDLPGDLMLDSGRILNTPTHTFNFPGGALPPIPGPIFAAWRLEVDAHSLTDFLGYGKQVAVLQGTTGVGDGDVFEWNVAANTLTWVENTVRPAPVPYDPGNPQPPGPSGWLEKNWKWLALGGVSALLWLSNRES